MQPVGTYSPDAVVVAWGPILFSGFAKGSFVKLSKPDVAQTNSTQGADGHVARVVRRSAPLRKVEVTLLQTSETNTLLRAQAEADRLTGTVLWPFTIKDLSGSTLYSSPQAWIAERPEGEFAQEATNRPWMFEGLWSESEGGNAQTV